MLMDKSTFVLQHETLYLGEKRIRIRTSVLEEKATACNMLCCYADELKEGFFPYVEEVGQQLRGLAWADSQTIRAARPSPVHKLQSWSYLVEQKCCAAQCTLPIARAAQHSGPGQMMREKPVRSQLSPGGAPQGRYAFPCLHSWAEGLPGFAIFFCAAQD